MKVKYIIYNYGQIGHLFKRSLHLVRLINGQGLLVKTEDLWRYRK